MGSHGSSASRIPTELVERLEVAEAGSRDLDKAILAHLGFTWRGMNYWNGNVMWTGSSFPTTSLDGAVALAERLLPGAGWNIRRNDWGHTAEVYPYEPDTRTEAQKLGFSFTTYEPKTSPFGSAPTPALALCIAILKATTAHAVGTKPEGRSAPNTPGEGEGL